MTATIAIVVGLLVAGVVIFATRRRETTEATPPDRPTIVAWLALGFGVAALLAFGLSALALLDATVPSISLAVAAVAIGIADWVRGDRTWATWVGLAAGGVPAVFWLVFFIGQLVLPH